MTIKKLNKIGRIAYRLANSGLVFIVLLFSSKILNESDYALIVLISGFSTIAIAFLDIYPYKFLISRFSGMNYGGLSVIIKNKIFWFIFNFFLIHVFLVLYYDLSHSLAFLILTYCFFSIVNVTFSSYVFAKNKNSYILLIPPVVFFFLSLILYIYVDYYSVLTMFFFLVLYRGVEFLSYGLSYFLFNVKIAPDEIDDVSFFDGKYFYIQNLISMLSGNFIAILAPIYLSTKSISLYGNINVLMAIVIFYGVFFSSTYYSDYISNINVNSKQDFIKILKIYIEKSIKKLMPMSLLVSMFGLYYYSVSVLDVIYILVYSLTISFTSIQAFLLFKFSIQKFIVIISILTLVINCSLLIIFLPILDYYGLFLSNIIVQITSIIFCFSKIYNNFKE